MPTRRSQRKYVDIKLDPVNCAVVRVPAQLVGEPLLGHVEIEPWGIKWTPRHGNRYARKRAGSGFTWEELDELWRMLRRYGSASAMLSKLRSR
jgi:hypothetical protein